MKICNAKMRQWGGIALVVTALGLIVEIQPLYSNDQPAPVTKEASAANRAVVKKVLPAVVSIVATPKKVRQVAQTKRFNRRSFDGVIPDDIRRLLEDLQGQGLEETPRGQSMGSGVIVRPEGVILTNNHVVRGADSVTVTLQDGRRFETSDILRDPKTDLAIVRLDPKVVSQIPVASLGDSDAIEVGDWVLAMGAPFQLSGTVTAGIVSAKGRAPDELGLMYMDFIQTDAAINPGNSGGPIVNLDSQIVGINTAIRSGTGSFAGVGFSIPSNMARDVVEQLLKYGKVRRGYLGIQMKAVRPDESPESGAIEGVQINSLTEGQTPARKAGLQKFDVITHVDGRRVKDTKELQSYVSRLPQGTRVELKLNRKGEPMTIPVTIEEQPEEFGMNRERRVEEPENQVEITGVKIGNLGLAVAILDRQNAQQFGFDPNDKGLLVIDVEEESPADNGGFSEGMLIKTVDRKPVAAPEDLARMATDESLREGLMFKVQVRDGSTKLLVVSKK